MAAPAAGKGEFPGPVRAALMKAADSKPTSWRMQFSKCRAQVMLAVVNLAHGLYSSSAAPAETSALLKTAETVVRVAREGAAQSPLLCSFGIEAVSSLVALWALLGLPATPEDSRRACSVSATCLCLGEAAVAPPATAARQLRYLALSAKVLVQTVARQREPMQLGPLLSSASTPDMDVPCTVLALICCECVAQLQDRPPPTQASAAVQRIVAELVQAYGVKAFAQMQQSGTSASQKDAMAQTEAAVACLVGLVCFLRVASGHGSAAASGQHLQRFAEVLGKPDAPTPVTATLVSVLPKAPKAAKQKALEPILQLASTCGPEVQAYAELLEHADGGSVAAAPMCSTGAGASTAIWLHRLAEAAFDLERSRPVREPSPSLSVSGPPLMVTVRTSTSWSAPGEAHVVLRIDIFNATGLSYRHLVVGQSLCRCGKQGEQERQYWKYPPGVAKPTDHSLEALPCRASTTLWRDFFVSAVEPLAVAITMTYDNVAVDSAAPSAAVGTQGGTRANTEGNMDIWSSDDEEDNFRLHFACQPCPLPLSVFFSPFRGFDTPISTVYPPPMIFVVCQHSKVEDISECGVDLDHWCPDGFHAVTHSPSSLSIAPSVHACVAGLNFDGESIVCFLGRLLMNGQQQLEVRSNSERLVNILTQNLAFWMSSTSCAG